MASGILNQTPGYYYNGSFPWTITSGGTGVNSDNPIRVYKYGNVVILSLIFWSLTINNPNSNNLAFKLPWRNALTRVQGNAGYNNSGVWYIPIASDGDIFGFNIKNANGSTTDVTGNSWKNHVGQYTLIYMTEGTKNF